MTGQYDMVGGIGGNIQYSGGAYGDGPYDFTEEILKWTGEDWEQVGKMKKGRGYHAVSTIRMDDDAMKFCK